MLFEPEAINVELVRRLVAGQFPHWAHLEISPAEPQGWDNRTFRLGPDLSVRLPSAEGYVPQIEKEQRWLPRLAPDLPLPVPVPLAQGKPAEGYPWPWSVYRWLEGEVARPDRLDDPKHFALTLADFLSALQKVDPRGGPPPGSHSFFRGGSLQVYDDETRRAIVTLENEIDGSAATTVWETALASPWRNPPVWFHGDIAADNLLIRDGRLAAVIDFGCSGVGDPACDLTITWTFLRGESREIFRSALSLDAATWARARGWALWKALITFHDPDSRKAAAARYVVAEVLADRQ